MRIYFNTLIATGVLVAGLVASTGRADNFNPPPWGSFPLTVHAEWDFTSQPADLGAIFPDSYSNIGDGSHAFTNNWLWGNAVATFNDDVFGWRLGGAGDGLIYNKTSDTQIGYFALQNWVDNYPNKYIRIQFDYLSDFGPMIVTNILFWEGNNLTPTTVSPLEGLIGSGTKSGNERWEDWKLNPNPDYENIEVAFPPGASLTQIVIDTISVPEPSAVAIFVIGGLVFLARKVR